MTGRDPMKAAEIAKKIAQCPVGPFAILLGMTEDHWREVVAARQMIVDALRAHGEGSEKTK